VFELHWSCEGWQPGRARSLQTKGDPVVPLSVAVETRQLGATLGVGARKEFLLGEKYLIAAFERCDHRVHDLMIFRGKPFGLGFHGKYPGAVPE